MQLCAALMKQLFARAKRQNKSASLNTKHGSERSGWWSLDLSGQLGYPLTLEIQGWYGSQPFLGKALATALLLRKAAFSSRLVFLWIFYALRIIPLSRGSLPSL